MADPYQRLVRVLDELEVEMRRVGLWGELPPPCEAFESSKPFCIDTMTFEQWLQWVLIRRSRALVDQRGRFPLRSQVAPLAVLYLQALDVPSAHLIEILRRFDGAAGDLVEP